MLRMAKIGILAIAFSLLAIGLTFFTNRPVDAAPGPTNVNVVNTAGNPVPTAAQGVTAVSGTINLASGSSVNVANSLNATGPVPLIVRDVDNAGLNPFAVGGSCPTGCAVSISFPSTTASGGAVQTAVIDFVSAVCTGLATGITQDMFNFGFTLRGQGNELFFPVVVQSGIGTMAQQTSIYVDPGSSANLGTPGNNSGCNLTVTGHLIPQ